MFRLNDRRPLTVPMHFSKSVPKGTLYTIIRSSGMSVDEFRRLLK
jgi:predicted RNA binding protein YcfA (HicA-like mRNA interferase family)